VRRRFPPAELQAAERRDLDERTSMQQMFRPARASALAITALTALVLTPVAFGHARVSPPVVVKGSDQVFTLTVPTEKEGLTTKEVELRVPEGFLVFSLAPSPGWKQTAVTEGVGEEAHLTSVTWAGGATPFGEVALFQFVGSAESRAAYRFTVRQTYSDDSVVDWSGSPTSDAPAPVIEAKSSLGGGGSSTLELVALVVAGVALLVALGGLTAGRRPLA
jgi:uncharacterized protein YcnI